jgi:hypothetical protein
MSNPWMKFYPSDWRADPALRMCSIGARGLWMEMLCIMHEAHGYLKVNDKELLPRQLAALAGCSADDVTAYLLELSDAGVFSRDEAGVIYSRRMRKDIQRAEEDKANGRKGGNPRLKGGVNPPDNPPVGGGDKAQKPEARSQNPEAREKKEDDQAALSSAGRHPREYAFEAGVIRLTEIDLARWVKAFDAINVQAELYSLADWAGKQPNWFNAVAGALAKKDRDARDRVEKIKAAALAPPAVTAGRPKEGFI